MKCVILCRPYNGTVRRNKFYEVLRETHDLYYIDLPNYSSPQAIEKSWFKEYTGNIKVLELLYA
jgi:benzoyl-CoA reductase/2-hydroxyglutaryl-CoA dehydratase subunit BcrC/BadD/HgdB